MNYFRRLLHCLTIIILVAAIHPAPAGALDNNNGGALEKQAGNEMPADVDSTGGVSAEKQALIKELIKLMKVDKNMHEVVDQMFTMQKAMLLKSMERSAMSPQKRKSVENALSRATQRFGDALFNEIDMPAYVDDVYVEVYSKYYSAPELKDLISFYKSATGQKFINMTPIVAKDAMVIFQQRMLPKIQTVSARILKEEFEAAKEEEGSPSEDKPADGSN